MIFAVRISIAALLLPLTLAGARLPIRTYTAADGLARDHILCIHQDSRGFIWFCTPEGLSRFDGYQFTTYRTEQGLPANAVNSFLEAADGSYWVSTSRGACRFHATSPNNASSRFQCVEPPSYQVAGASTRLFCHSIADDRAGGIWCGTNEGVFHLGPKDQQFQPIDLTIPHPAQVDALLLDRRGTLWVGSHNGLYRREAGGGAFKRLGFSEGLPNEHIMNLTEDRQGAIWIGTRIGLAEVDPTGKLTTFAMQDGLPANRIESFLEASDGTQWVGTNAGLAERRPGEKKFQSYSVDNGLAAVAVGPLAEDRDNNIWIGSYGSGAMRLSRDGFHTYTAANGAKDLVGILETRSKELAAVVRPLNGLELARFDGRQFVPIRPAWPAGMRNFGWGNGKIAIEDHLGEWWVATGEGLARFAAHARLENLDGAHPMAIYTTRNGLPGNIIIQIFEDSNGDIWIGTLGPGQEDGVSRWNRSTGKIETFLGSGEGPGLPRQPGVTGFVEDRAHNIWMTRYHAGVIRYSRGKFRFFNDADGVDGFLEDIFLDSKGRLWIGSTRGLFRVDDPTVDTPHFVRYTTKDGLSSVYVYALSEDRFGRLYAATGRGIDRFEPQPQGLGSIRHYTSADGIAPGEVGLALCDHSGALWFGTPLGLSRFEPTFDRPRTPPPVLITAVDAGGMALPVSDVGQASVAGLKLDQVPLRIDFIGLGYSPGESLLYQYKLEGADTDWSQSIDHRSVLYGALPSGSYRFLIRAVASDGTLSAEPASVSFRILPPLWRTWWFLASCAVVIACLAFAWHQYRLRQLLAVANLRTRIATDLHDDIGASLSQIAVLSEVARQIPQDTGRLSEIAGIARELIDSMNDIVWAINPEHDRLSSLVHRMRRFATDLLGGRKIALQFRSSVSDGDLRLGADVRRQVYLMFKEGVNNIAKHSAATNVHVDLDLDRDGDKLVLRLEDNGRGFDPTAFYEGRGLGSLKARAAALHGTAVWVSSPGDGTTLTMTVKLEPSVPWQSS